MEHLALVPGRSRKVHEDCRKQKQDHLKYPKSILLCGDIEFTGPNPLVARSQAELGCLICSGMVLHSYFRGLNHD